MSVWVLSASVYVFLSVCECFFLTVGVCMFFECF